MAAVRTDSDFASYVGARWPSLVRSLVLLGCPEQLAPDVAQAALAAVQRGWDSTRESADVDVVVHRALLEAWEDRLRTRWWERVAGPPDTEVDAELVRELDRLPRDTRAAVVLERHAGLTPAQRAAVLSGSGELPPSPGTDELRYAVQTVVVLAPPQQAAVVAQRHRRSRRRLAVVAVPVVLVVAFLAAVTWWTTRADDPEELGPVDVRLARNPAPVAWYADSELHLAHVVLEVPDLRQVELVSGGAAYVDGRNRVVVLADDGTRTVLGTQHPETTLVVSDEDGWVAWVEPEGEDPAGPHLMVRELASGETLIDRPLVPPELAGAMRLIAIDGGLLYYRDGHGTAALTVRSGGVDTGNLGGLVDVASRTQAFDLGNAGTRVEQGFFDVEVDVPGSDAQLSEDGNFVLTRVGEGAFGPVLVHDTRSGADVSTGLGPDDVAVVAELGPEETITYVIARAVDRPEDGDFLRSSFTGQLELRTCDLETGECESLERFPSTGTGPLLAG